MRFSPKARLDTSRVSDRAGSGGGGSRGGPSMRLPIPGGAKAGGGLGVVIMILVVVAINFFGGGGGNGGGSPLDSVLGGAAGTDSSRMADTERYANCTTGEDANQDVDCARVAVENSLYSYWRATLSEQAFRPATLSTFSGGVTTDCGQASSQMGPFYCPADQGIYLDTTFFADVLEKQLGGRGGDFVEPYVLAHEYGHHIQNLLGTMGKVRTQQGPTSDAVRLELQADCYAGMWTRAAEGVGDVEGVPLIADLDEGDVQEAIDSAKAVGDDRIQKRSGGRVDPEGWTHGSSEQRVRWFEVGRDSGDLRACDTFAARRL
ncbi:neutral zinc metallopeptidase [Nocardioides gilvus]|uniref:KPN_02809 family neutral zinc metallopeptidase n=1 Tax=Nocardioides gilvus TaxID=1735589 RepID=UPI000D74FB38|nr:neutral zinc metallopeptidase [Nocardioides gilvus]